MNPWGNLGRQRQTAGWPRGCCAKSSTYRNQVARATAYLSGLGLSELYLNGRKVGDHVLSPALSEYTKRVFLCDPRCDRAAPERRNALGVLLGNGRFYAPRTTSPAKTVSYGFPKLLLQLEVEYTDGTRETVVSDASWKLTTDGPIRANNEYDGEEYDARKELPGWASRLRRLHVGAGRKSSPRPAACWRPR